MAPAMRSSVVLTLLAACAALQAGPRTPGVARAPPSSTALAAAERPFDPYAEPPVLGTNRHGKVWVPQARRPRRNRKSPAVRALVRDVVLEPGNFIYPLFIHELDYNEPIASMPGCERHSLTSLVKEVGEARGYGVKTVILFPKVAEALKSNEGEEAYNPDGLVPRAIKAVKEAYPDVTVCTDVALDPYSSMGHDGIVRDGKIVNDETVVQLMRQSVMQADAGADIIGCSDMMDGRVGAIRDALDAEGHTDVSIMSYTAKYASAFYGPFRDALDSHPGFGDKKTYQQDPANSRDALIEAELDVAEGADILMVKPAMAYLDVIQQLATTNLPIAAYHVSGEYAMVKAAAERGWLDEKAIFLESFISLKRAGCNAILTYAAKDAAKWLAEDS